MEIGIINEVQLLLARAGKKLIDLPMIIAVGSQSSGKSSVIERMIGREFLPKGSGIVTKRPLIIQMNHVTSGKESYEFAHKSGHIFHSTSDVMNEIVAETERVCGTDRSAVSEIPISLIVRSPNVVNLTVVDLPGLTSIAVSGQDESIVKKIHAMVHKFASSQNSVILSVMPANQDLANSAALQLAKAVDPEGLRTIGVITKIDLMDSGTDCLDILQNKVYTLKLGFIGVVNRNQKQIASKMDYNKSLELEANFFQSHPIYNKVRNTCGTSYLQHIMQKILIETIKKSKYKMIMSFRQQLSEIEIEISDLEVKFSSLSNEPPHVRKIKSLSKIGAKIGQLYDAKKMLLALSNVYEDLETSIMTKCFIPNGKIINTLFKSQNDITFNQYGYIKECLITIFQNSQHELNNSLSKFISNSLNVLEEKFREIIEDSKIRQSVSSCIKSKLMAQEKEFQSRFEVLKSIYSKGLLAGSSQTYDNYSHYVTPASYTKAGSVNLSNIAEGQAQSYTIDYQTILKKDKTILPRDIYTFYYKIDKKVDEKKSSVKITRVFFINKLGSREETNTLKITVINSSNQNKLIAALTNNGFLDRCGSELEFLRKIESEEEFINNCNNYNDVEGNLKILGNIVTVYISLYQEIVRLCLQMRKLMYKFFVKDMQNYVYTILASEVISMTPDEIFSDLDQEKIFEDLDNLRKDEVMLKSIIDALKKL